ncbi:cytoplasmic tRNA 2-thiolation protein 2 [Anastrepha ludens]|uniref:cytoplasmic tRNA 2-thiolation protein 2 n=1 Tax=Anastrepha ludens TaxID=28586 RepID=UPI0023B060BF|nr:cytoplasmic tRNA 2-thiolation protein 2 [Anastrepha ludens]
MCSLNDENFGDDGDADYMTPQTEKVLSEPKGICHKCGQDGEIYKLHFREAECKICFIQYVNHKFRATVGSSKLLPRNAVILLVFDGSAEAIVLLDMLQKAQIETNFKRLCCEFKILFIDDYELTNKNLNAIDYSSYIKTVQEFLFKQEGVKSYVINLRCGKDQEPFDIDNIDSYLARETDKEKIFASNFYRIQTTTSRKEFLRMHRNKLIASVSQYLNCRYVFIPSININVAADLLSSIVLGHGNNAALDVAFLDDRLGNGIKLMRPLKDLSQSEVILYVRARNLKTLKTSPDLLSGCGNSLQDITELFIQDLQKNYKSTVSTIFRTGSKIAPNNYPNPEGKECIIQNSENQSTRYGLCTICNSLFLAESKTLLAVEYSRYVSKEVVSPIESFPDHKEYLNCKSKQGKSLCHRCENMQRDCEVNLM